MAATASIDSQATATYDDDDDEPAPPAAVDPAEAAPPEGHWACPACTFFNEPGARQCEMCGTRQPPSVTAAAPPAAAPAVAAPAAAPAAGCPPPLPPPRRRRRAAWRRGVGQVARGERVGVVGRRDDPDRSRERSGGAAGRGRSNEASALADQHFTDGEHRWELRTQMRGSCFLGVADADADFTAGGRAWGVSVYNGDVRTCSNYHEWGNNSGRSLFRRGNDGSEVTFVITLRAPPPAERRRCQRGHELTPFRTTHAHFTCDGCRRSMEQDAECMSCRNCDYDLCADCCPPPGNSSWSLSYEVTSTAGSETFTLPVTIGSRVRLTPWVRMSEAGHSITLRGLTSAAPAVADFDAAAAAAAPSASPAVVAPRGLLAAVARRAPREGRCAPRRPLRASRHRRRPRRRRRRGRARRRRAPRRAPRVLLLAGGGERAAGGGGAARRARRRLHLPLRRGRRRRRRCRPAPPPLRRPRAARRRPWRRRPLQLCGATERYMATAAAAAGPLWQAQLSAVHPRLARPLGHALAGDLLLGGTDASGALCEEYATAASRGGGGGGGGGAHALQLGVGRGGARAAAAAAR